MTTAVPLEEPTVAVIVAVPGVTAVTVPEPATTATDGALLDHEVAGVVVQFWLVGTDCNVVWSPTSSVVVLGWTDTADTVHCFRSSTMPSPPPPHAASPMMATAAVAKRAASNRSRTRACAVECLFICRVRS